MAKTKQKNISPKKEIKSIAPAIKGNHYIILALILLVTFISYFSIFHNGFVWDDSEYIQNNSLLRSFNLKAIFSSYIVGNYHPLTILIHALEYHFFALNETGYHAVNLIFHLFNIILVFYTVFLLCKKAEVALVACLLFGIHPLHVESVAWASELKDVLYTFFFLSSYIFYLKYLKNKSGKFYIYSLLLFLFSLLSKAMAAPFPIVLLLTDYFMSKDTNGRTKIFDSKNLLEKIPFFALSIIFGIISVFAQQSHGAMGDITVVPFYQRIIVACYGFITYLIKLILPLNLSAFYPYPYTLTASYYLYVLGFILIIFFTIYSLHFSKKIFFGIGFFLVTIFLVLQLFPVGGAIIADRYTYLSSIGIFYLAGEGLYWLWSKNYKLQSVIILSAFTLFFSITTYARCDVWKDEMTLWNDVISQYQIIPNAYNMRGDLFLKEKKYDEALSDFNKAIELKPDYSDPYYNRGILFANEGKYLEALNNYNKAIELNPGYFGSYNNRGNILEDNKRYDEALKDFNKAIELKPDFEKSYNNRGNVLMDEKKYDESIIAFNKAIELKPDYDIAYFNRGMAEYFSDKKDLACKDFLKASGFGFQPATDFYNKHCH